ncbi:T9SS type B sorting domain-containing protein [Flavivirga rizhaonensis]|uniref:T9SS type B sorting domain-containing protein n=2 Tax=Flavivirga rizhaonensis TaxID=2559571 RepID=A0A4S1DQU8_9FLAO|nr:T9SS type B sorting domain-containing protein [Flavivirga rizhaonensis]
MFSCERDEGWSRVFKLSDFGILPSQQFAINSGEVAFSKSNSGAFLQFNVFSIDEDFPTFFHSLYPRTLLGSRGIGQAPVINGSPEIVRVDFDEPIIVPAGVDRILVTVKKIEDFYNPESAEVFIAGTLEDTGVSWYEGCDENYSLTPTTDLVNPVSNANFYINVTGETVSIQSSGTRTRLSHNVCDDIIETNIHSCTSSYIYWARAFTLEDFGISTNEEFVINSGQVGINKTGWLPEISFNIYKIDNNFPASFSETDLIGSSQYQQLSPNIDRTSQIIEVEFDNPIIIPADVERILVEVHKGIVYGDGVAFIAGSSQDNDVSWQRGCTNVAGGTYFDPNEYVSTDDFGRPNANFYINVTGNVNHITNNFEMSISNICSEFLKEFSLENKTNVASVIWNFGDPASGIDNTSTDLSPFHDFSADGTYTITATVTGNDNSVEVLTETIDVKEPPTAYGIDNIYACEDSFDSGFSSSFDVLGIYNQVLGGQTDKIVTFINGNGNQYNVLPSPFSNTVKDRETIIVRVAHKDNLCCYSETSFDLIANPLPNISSIQDIENCDNDYDGITSFNLTPIQDEVITDNPSLTVEFFHENGQQIANPLPESIDNIEFNEEIITVRVTNPNTKCYNETTFKLIVNPLPIAHTLTELMGCDDNGDGISRYFDTSNVENNVLGGQTGMEVSYYDSDGNLLPYPFPNPYTNKIPNKETITVRVTNTQTNCYIETTMVLKTSNKPKINTPDDIYVCDEGGGFSTFDLSAIENEIIGSQVNLNVFYYDESGNHITSLIDASFQNTQAWAQIIHVRVENVFSPVCFSQISFKLRVNALPQIPIEENYFLCNLEQELPLVINEAMDFWEWQYEDGSILSNTNEVSLIEAGAYKLTIGKVENGIICQNTYDFELIRSILPTITSIDYQDLSDNNFIIINASGDGDFEYSIDGINYQKSNEFQNVSGGIYTVSVRDKLGCGKDLQQLTLIDCPKFFTPNGDNYNDYWQVRGLANDPNAKIFIYDRYGKLLKQITSNSIGWDGMCRGEKMPSDDYWFTVKLDDGRLFKGHFTLKR